MALDIDVITKRWKLAQEQLSSWRADAREDYEFSAIRQWRQEDMAAMEAEERPALTFDRVGAFLDAVCGMEVNNRQAIKFFPVEEGDVHTDDILTQTAKYYEDDCGAADEDSEAARDALICGVGATESVMDYQSNPDGAPIVLRRDPLMCWWDPASTRRNLRDRRYVFLGHWMPEEDAKARWPDAEFAGTEPYSMMAQPHRADRAFMYKEDETGDEHKGLVFILQYQCYENEPVYRMKHPVTGEMAFLTPEQFKAAKLLIRETIGKDPVKDQDYVKQTKKCYYKAYLSGDTILEEDETQLDDFTVQFITYKRDRNKKCWYGMLRAAKDPARWANKWLSQVLHIMNTNAKNGAFAEVGAFKDPREAERQWAQPNSLILLKEGGIDKIRERGQGQYPSGLDRLMMFAFDSLPMVLGINLEALGLADREQAGVLEAQRRESAYAILAPFFAAIREYRKARGKLLLQFINKFIPDGTLVKITGDSGTRYVQLARSATRYDVKVDQAPDSPDFKQKTWDALQAILPPMMKAGYPIPPEVINYSPLPPDVAEKWVAWIKEQGWIPPEMQEHMQQMQQQLQSMGDENMKLKEENVMMRVDSSVEMAKLQNKMRDADMKAETKAYQVNVDSANRGMEATLDARMRQLEIMAQEKQASIQHQIDLFKTLVDAYQKQLSGEKEEEPKPAPKKFKIKKTSEGMYEILEDIEAA